MAPKKSATQGPPLRCSKCMAIFPDQRGLYLHQQKSGHLHCTFCKRAFHSLDALIQHRADDHKKEQDLPCPGCNNKFTSAGSWMSHVERGECYAIFPSDISGNIPEMVKSISKALRETGLGITKDVDLSVNPSASFPEIKDVWGDEWKKEQSLKVEDHPEQFPRTAKQQYYQGGSNQSDLLTGDGSTNLEQQRPLNAWAQKKNLFPEKTGTPAIRPPPSLLQSMTNPSHSIQPTGERILDPYHPNFNVGLFKDPILETFKCPHKTCNSKLKSANGLIAHLKSPAHTAPRFKCPGCADFFTSGASWIQHAETVSITKCKVRNDRIFELAIKQVTNGALDIKILNGLADGTAKMKFDEDWAASKQRNGSGPVPGSDAWVEEKNKQTSSSTSNPQSNPRKKVITHEEYQFW
ncbi:uncharacterized protein F4812DRAFT_469784 [Daldinia caldariorum]|uniref:uncharacterized protein n=1 Tax=Daldinia caldariorum TaxID=326644 RepID=UPI0020087B54|nr:uncharacterized protein F4812DRAFT_469784 [Daldinia caldariorum]KAI1469689.1 hypothetical protein F4812DRAFT_469784 [Daldinia caldariorum]